MVQDDGVLRQESVNAWSNGLGPVAQLKVLVNSATHEDRHFTYDDAGRIAQEGVYVGNALSHTNSYVYDVLGRLTNATQGGGSHQYSYDWAGNPLTKYYNGNPTTHTYNAANRMLTVNGVTEFAYDANGNMTQSGAQALTWDVRGQLRSVGGSSFSYDAFGRRTVKTEPTILGGTTTKNYNWTGWSQTNGTQAPVVGSSLDSPIRLVRGADNSVRVPVQDSHGNITKVINGGSGATLFEAHYSPFGERAITNGSISSGDGSGQPFGFTGAEHDSVSELVYLRNRYYAPGLGRFISEDPAGFAGSPDGNLFAYCGNDPINFSDPLGLFAGFGLNGGGICGAGNNPWFWFGDPPTFGPSALYRKGAYRCTPAEGEAEFAGADRFGGNWRIRPGMTGGTDRSQMANDMLDGTYNQVLGATAAMATGWLPHFGPIQADGMAENPLGLGTSRVRHHTDLNGLEEIKSSGTAGMIEARRRGGVFVEVAPFGQSKPGFGGPGSRFGCPEGAFIEFDANNSELFYDFLAGPGNSFGIRGDVHLDGRNPVFVKVNMWYRIREWFDSMRY